MRPSSMRGLAGVALVSALSVGPPAAAELIEEFAGFGTATEMGPGGSSSASGGGGLGGNVDLNFDHTAGSGRIGLTYHDVSFGVASTLIVYSESRNTGTLELQWDGDAEPGVASDLDPAGLGSVDLTDGGSSDAVLVSLVTNDVPASFTIVVYSAGGSESSSVTVWLPVVALPTVVAVPFASFAGAADFSDASAMVVTLLLADAADLTFTRLATGPMSDGTAPGTPLGPPSPPVATPGGSLVIEEFAGGSSGSTDLGPGGSSSLSAVNPASLGGALAIDVDNLTGPANLRADRNAATQPGLLLLHGLQLNTGSAIASWDGDLSTAIDPAGLGSVDLTAGGLHDRFLVGTEFSDVAFTLEFTLYSNGGTEASTGALAISALEPGGRIYELPFADLVGTADPTQASALVMAIDWAASLDLALDFLATGVALPRPDLGVEGNGIPIPDGDATPTEDDGTEFGLVPVGYAVERSFVLVNSGTAPLALELPVAISGGADYSVATQPTTPIADGSGTSELVIRFAPQGSGDASATVTIASDDPDEDPYTFVVSGTGFASPLEIPALDPRGLLALAALLAVAGWAVLRRRTQVARRPPG